MQAAALAEKKSAYAQQWLGKSEQFLLENPARAALIAEYFTDQNQPLYQWMASPTASAAPHQELRTEPSPAGYKVRSKSEVLAIVVMLEQGRYFRYEDPLLINGTVYYPDFTIRDPVTGKTFWYEHFGKMDDPLYARRQFKKLKDYAAGGLIIGVNLIATFETSTHKLGIPQIQNALTLIDQ